MNAPAPPLRLALIGYGRMGREIEQHAIARGMEITARIDLETHSLATAEVKLADVAIHYAYPATVLKHVRELGDLGKPVVVGTTGWQQDRAALERLVASSGIGLVYASNFSIGVNILNRLVRQAGILFDRFAEYDVSIHEVHHKDKIDAPSGTALTLAAVLLDTIKRKKELLRGSAEGKIKSHQLQITSGRHGSVVGTHQIAFDSAADTLEIVHTAKNRSGFAQGTLLAAEWVKDKKGMYSFEEILEDMFQQPEKGS